HAVAGEKHEREVGAGGALLKVHQCIEEAFAVEIKAARRRAIACNHLEPVPGEELRHTTGIELGVLQRRQPDGCRGAARGGGLADYQRDAASICRRHHQKERSNDRDNASQYHPPPCPPAPSCRGSTAQTYITLRSVNTLQKELQSCASMIVQGLTGAEEAPSIAIAFSPARALHLNPVAPRARAVCIHPHL